ncbi:MAG: hypothetical protein ACRD0K_29530 [Egibacteraceae bacterium]
MSEPIETEGADMATQVTRAQKALKGVDYPASGDELSVICAERGGAAGRPWMRWASWEASGSTGPNGAMKGFKGDLGGPTKE